MGWKRLTEQIRARVKIATPWTMSSTSSREPRIWAKAPRRATEMGGRSGWPEVEDLPSVGAEEPPGEAVEPQGSPACVAETGRLPESRARAVELPGPRDRPDVADSPEVAGRRGM